MLIVQLNPQLHEVVRMLKTTDVQKNVNPFIRSANLSNAESSAVNKTMKSPAKKDQKEPLCQWE